MEQTSFIVALASDDKTRGLHKLNYPNFLWASLPLDTTACIAIAAVDFRSVCKLAFVVGSPDAKY